jgi:methionyl-tRNA synthetase
MTEGSIPDDVVTEQFRLSRYIKDCISTWVEPLLQDKTSTAPLHAGVKFVTETDRYINDRKPFTLAKNLDQNKTELEIVLYDCAEAIRIAAVLLSPAMPTKMAELLRRFGQEPPRPDGSFTKPLAELCQWGGLKPGTPITKGDILFPRADADAPAPAAVAG